MTAAAPIIAFADADAMAARIADLIAAELRAAIGSGGSARLAVSGGSTPAKLHAALASRRLDWSNVTVIPVDERWVESDHPGSNETFITTTLLHSEAAAARLFRVKTRDATSEEGARRVDAELKRLGPLDVAVLGMGPDGHTASWFPECDGLAAAIDPAGARSIVGVTARKSEVTGDLLDRVTLTASYLKQARRKILLMQGEKKRDAFETARRPGPLEIMPVRALLRDAPDLWAAWAP